MSKHDGRPKRDKDTFFCRVQFDNRANAFRFIRERGLDLVETEEDDQGRVIQIVLLTKDEQKTLRAAGFEIDVLENASKIGRRRQKEVGRGDRFKDGKVPPKGLGNKVGGQPR